MTMVKVIFVMLMLMQGVYAEELLSTERCSGDSDHSMNTIAFTDSDLWGSRASISLNFECFKGSLLIGPVLIVLAVPMLTPQDLPHDPKAAYLEASKLGVPRFSRSFGTGQGTEYKVEFLGTEYPLKQNTFMLVNMRTGAYNVKEKSIEMAGSFTKEQLKAVIEGLFPEQEHDALQ